MLPSVRVAFIKSTVWQRIMVVSVIFFFIGISDSVLAYWVPPFIQKTLGSPVLMGLVLSFSSVVGIAADMLLPQIIRGASLTKLVSWAMFFSLAFGSLLLFSSYQPIILVLLLAMGTWGVYYELLSFSRQQFLADNTPHNIHASASAIIFAFRGLAYTVGPLAASILLVSGERTPIMFALVMTIVGGIALRLSRLGKHGHVDIDVKKVNIVAELGHWKTLFSVVWPMVTLSVFMGIIDSVFWTTGAVLSEGLSSGNSMSRFILPAYMLPMVIVGPVLARMRVVSGKKKKAELSYLLSGLVLILVGFVTNISALVFFVLVSGILSAATYPLVDAVYSDIIARMGKQRYHLIGLSSSANSLAYIVGPTIAGVTTEIVGEQRSFAVFGVGAVILSLVLLLVTKKKLILPQGEISGWS